MRVIIAGTRTVVTMAILEAAILSSGFDITEVVCGDAPGPDTLGWKWAEARGIPVTHFPAHWYRNGKLDKTAGLQRNTRMGLYTKEVQGGLIALWDGSSAGTGHMVKFARRCGLETYVETVIQAPADLTANMIGNLYGIRF